MSCEHGKHNKVCAPCYEQELELHKQELVKTGRIEKIRKRLQEKVASLADSGEFLQEVQGA